MGTERSPWESTSRCGVPPSPLPYCLVPRMRWFLGLATVMSGREKGVACVRTVHPGVSRSAVLMGWDG